MNERRFFRVLSCFILVYLGVSIVMGVPINGWFNHGKSLLLDDLKWMMTEG